MRKTKTYICFNLINTCIIVYALYSMNKRSRINGFFDDTHQHTQRIRNLKTELSHIVCVLREELSNVTLTFR